jgi:flagellar M-ring protein FliF
VPALKQDNTTETLEQPGGASTNGVLGVGGTGAGTAATSGPTNYRKTTTRQENGVNSTQITADTPPGAVKRLSVSAVLDSAVVPTDADLTKWENQIQAAAGIVPDRDGADALQVTTVAFDQEAQEAARAKAASGGGDNTMFDLIKQVLTLLMIGLVLFFAWRAIKRAEANRVPLRVPLDLRELEMPATAELEGAAPVPAMAGARRPLETAPASVEGEITDLIERQPDEVAQTLRSWLADRRS